MVGGVDGVTLGFGVLSFIGDGVSEGAGVTGGATYGLGDGVVTEVPLSGSDSEFSGTSAVPLALVSELAAGVSVLVSGELHALTPPNRNPRVNNDNRILLVITILF